MGANDWKEHNIQAKSTQNFIKINDIQIYGYAISFILEQLR
jgi:hypothetical protein